MCSGSQRKPASPGGSMMEGEIEKQYNCSILLELSASDDLIGFKSAIEEESRDVDEASMWYGRRLGSKRMCYETRTPLMIAAMFGSMDVLSYILETGQIDVNQVCGLDRATALHCAVAGGSSLAPWVVKALLDASADVNAMDANGNCPSDLIAPITDLTKKLLEVMLQRCANGEAFGISEEQELLEIPITQVLKEGADKKEHRIDLSLPDIKNGIYSTDEFRMYTFKVKPCSRAYSHDWTECPFVHPGENARRRDPRKYHYSCVPCPEFRKGSCRQGDSCEYAHGIFECWLHPAQYRTRLCKDETGCARRVCFFAHKLEELRPLYASTGSTVPSPRSYPGSSLDIGLLSPTVSSPMGGSVNMWQNQSNIAPPALQLPGSWLKAALGARDMDLDNELSGLPSPSNWNNGLSNASPFMPSSERFVDLNRRGGLKPTNLEDIFGSIDPAILFQLQAASLETVASHSQLQSPTGIQRLQSANQHLRSSYPASIISSSQSYGVSSCGAFEASALSSRAAAFAKRSQSFIERSSVNRHSGSTAMPSNISDWGSPNGKLDWGVQREELNKLRKSASFGFRSSSSNFGTTAATMQVASDEPDVSWVHSLVKDASIENPEHFGFEDLCHLDNGSSEKMMLPALVEHLYMEQEQMVA